MADEAPDRDPEIRKRAAWLLAMLALVAALFVVLMVTFFNTSGGDPDGENQAGPVDETSTSASPPSRTTTSAPGDSSPSGEVSGSGSSSSGSSSRPGGTNSASGTPSGGAPTGTTGTVGADGASCPSSAPCAFSSDIGDAVAAINALRTSNGKSAVPGSVSAAATACALSNGSDCDGGWAQTQVPAGDDGRPDGELAVEKIKQLGKLLANMKSIEVGWAYDPGSKQFLFATVRQG